MQSTQLLTISPQLSIKDGVTLADIVAQCQAQYPESIFVIVDEVNIRTYREAYPLGLNYLEVRGSWYYFHDRIHHYRVHGYQHALRWYPPLPAPVVNVENKRVVYQFTLTVDGVDMVFAQPMRELTGHTWYIHD